MPPLRLPSFLRPPGLAAWLAVAAVQIALLLTPGPAHAKNLSLREALAIPAATEAFPPSLPATPVSLPDDWAQSRPDYEGPVWYRLDFDARGLSAPLLAAYVERACSNLEVQLNGHLVFSGGRMNEPVSRNCYHSQLIILPSGLLKPSGNRLDIKVTGFPLNRVTARQRAAGLSPVMIGPLPAMQALHERQIFWNLTLAESIGAMLVVVGVLLLALGRLRKLSHLGYFGLLSCLWAALTARLWWRDIPLSNASVELLICAGFAPVVACIVLFLLRYAGYARDRRIDVALWLQCLATPLALALAGADHLFEAAMLWYALFGLEVLAAIVAFLHRSWQERSRDFWVMAGILCLLAALIVNEVAIQSRLVELPRVNLTLFAVPLLLCLLGLRMAQLFARALHGSEHARSELEERIRSVTAQMEHNFAQMADARGEQIAEKERKRIAADLHDDLGAKLLTIVHTSDNERIATLAREALEEMRLSVRGIAGKPIKLADALADWRAEVVQRLGQAGIEAEWDDLPDTQDRSLQARVYVQATRIVREAVSNMIKHSGASHCQVSCSVDATDFQLVVQDNGRGIPLELDGKLDRGHGMASMKHRAKQLRGQCLVESGPGYGTVIRVTLPL